jgi:hypothetical protein
MDAILSELGVTIEDEDQTEYLQATLTDLLGDDGGDPKDRAANMVEILFPMVEEAGYEGSEDDVLSACLSAFSPPATGLEEIWAQVEDLSADAFAWLRAELGQVIKQRGLGSREEEDYEPEPEPSEADILSAQLMRDASVQARKAQVARAAKIAEKEAAGPAPLASMQTLLGIILDDDIVEYLEGAAAGLRDDIADGANEADEAVEELFGLIGVHPALFYTAISFCRCVAPLMLALLYFAWPHSQGRCSRKPALTLTLLRRRRQSSVQRALRWLRSPTRVAVNPRRRPRMRPRRRTMGPRTL